jgi:hypothetical protein
MRSLYCGAGPDDEFVPRSVPPGKEGRHIAQLLKDFDYQRSDVWRSITRKFSTGIRHRELCSVAHLVGRCCGIDGVPRDARRSFPVLIKWFQDNWDRIQSVWETLGLLDGDGQPINYERQLRETGRVPIALRKPPANAE